MRKANSEHIYLFECHGREPLLTCTSGAFITSVQARTFKREPNCHRTTRHGDDSQKGKTDNCKRFLKVFQEIFTWRIWLWSDFCFHVFNIWFNVLEHLVCLCLKARVGLLRRRGARLSSHIPDGWWSWSAVLVQLQLRTVADCYFHREFISFTSLDWMACMRVIKYE